MAKIYGLFLLIFISASLKAQRAVDTSAYSITLTDQVVTAQYEPTHYKNAIHSIDVIKNEAMARRGVITLEQALTISPALRLYQDPILGTSITMRGVSASNVAILVDGVPVIGRQNGAVDLSQIAMQNVERIEIVQGPLSNIYGSNAAGGVINIISKKTQLHKWSANLSNQIESIGQRNHQGGLGYKIGRLTASVHARYFSYDQYPQDSLRVIDKITLSDGSVITRSRYPYNPKMQMGFGGLLRYDIKEESHLILKFDKNAEDVIDYGVKKRLQFKPYANDQFYHTNRSDLSLFYKSKWKNYFIDATVAINQYDRITEDKRYYLETRSFDTLLHTSDTTRFKTYFGRMNFIYARDKIYSINGGVSFTNENGKGDRIALQNNDHNAYASFSELAPYADVRYNIMGKLNTMVSLRYTMHSVYANKLTPAIQLKYDINARWCVRLGYAQGYRSPSLKELYLEFIDVNHNIIGNPDLKPETSYDVQGSLTYMPIKNIEFLLNMYHTTIKSRINLTEYDALKFKYENIDNYTVYGFQPSIKYNWKTLSIGSSASIGYWATNIDKASSPKYGQVIDINNNLTYEWSKAGFVFSANHRLSGNQPAYRLINDDVVISTISGFNILDLSIGKSIANKAVVINTGVRNVSNVKNTSITGNAASGVHSSDGRNVVSQGRSYFVNLSLNF
jgi:outer membrane receptor for ferrienterochelin and colicins